MTTKVKALKVLIAGLVLALAVVAVYNKVLVNRYSKNYMLQKEENRKLLNTTAKIKKAVIMGRTASMMHLNKIIKFENIKKIFPNAQTDLIQAGRPRLLLVFSELGCNVCQDDETAFAVNIAKEFGRELVFAVVYATNRRYVQNYIRMNRVNFPVYFCEDESFLKSNNIINTPMVFVLDKSNRVIASHFPIPGQKEYSEPMHDFCFYYFGKSHEHLL